MLIRVELRNKSARGFLPWPQTSEFGNYIVLWDDGEMSENHLTGLVWLYIDEPSATDAFSDVHADALGLLEEKP